VQPDELLRRNVTDTATEPAPPKVNLQRQQELERYLKPKPADVEAYLELAEIYRRAVRPIEARRTLKKGLEIHPDEPQLIWQLEEANLAQSIYQLREVTELARRLGTGEAQRELERAIIDWAARRVEVCEARLKRDPANLQLRVLLSEALKDMGRFEEAIEEADVASESDALAPTAHLIRGQCFQALNEMRKALQAYRAAAFRRAVPAPPRIRCLAMRAAMELAETLGLPQSYARYERSYKIATAELERQAAAPPPASGTLPPNASESDTRDIDMSSLS